MVYEEELTLTNGMILITLSSSQLCTFHTLVVLHNHLDSSLPTGKATTSCSPMLHLLARGQSPSGTGVATLRGAQWSRYIIILVNICALQLRICILHKRARNGVERVVW
jgi:hypothetical protein